MFSEILTPIVVSKSTEGLCGLFGGNFGVFCSVKGMLFNCTSILFVLQNTVHLLERIKALCIDDCCYH